jgi:hypothetical protein
VGTYLNWVAQKKADVADSSAVLGWAEIKVDKVDNDFSNYYVLYAFLGCSWRNASGVVTFPGVTECKDHPWTYYNDAEDHPPQFFCASIQELLAFDYDAHYVHNESLREHFQRNIELMQKLRDLGAERLCYYFD